MKAANQYAEALLWAAEVLGGPEALGAYFGAEEATVEDWLEGREVPPLEVFLDALDIISDGPIARRAARWPHSADSSAPGR